VFELFNIVMDNCFFRSLFNLFDSSIFFSKANIIADGIRK